MKRVMARFDQDGDGRLDFDEFQKYAFFNKRRQVVGKNTVDFPKLQRKL